MDGVPPTTLMSLFLGSNPVSVAVAYLIIFCWTGAVINWAKVLIFLMCSISK